MNMAEAVLDQKDTQVLRLRELASSIPSRGPAWFQNLKDEGVENLERLGFPSKRDEAWRFTDLRPIKNAIFALPPEGSELPDRQTLDSHHFLDLEKGNLTFVNGKYVDALSRAENLPEGATVRTFQEALEENEELLKSHLSKVANPDDFFAALNLASLQEGVVIEVPSGTVVEEPIYLNFLTLNDEDKPYLINTRVLIVCGDKTQVSILENHLGLGEEDAYLSNGVTEVIAGDNCVVDHYKLEHESDRGWHLATFESIQGRDSNVRNTIVTLSGAIIRNRTNSTLDGEGGWAELNGLFLVGDDHHVDNYTQLRHSKPHCDSREVYRGILADKANGVFRGRIVVDKGAQKTDSKQTNSNLLLSDHARMNTKPQLEIYADDVKCTHGATIGQLDAEQIFYLRSRGISKSAAQSMLIYAFASQLVQGIKIESFRELLDSYLFDWLPEGERVKEAF